MARPRSRPFAGPLTRHNSLVLPCPIHTTKHQSLKRSRLNTRTHSRQLCLSSEPASESTFRQLLLPRSPPNNDQSTHTRPSRHTRARASSIALLCVVGPRGVANGSTAKSTAAAASRPRRASSRAAPNAPFSLSSARAQHKAPASVVEHKEQPWHLPSSSPSQPAKSTKCST